MYRQTQGVVIAHASKVPCIPDYSTISRRINRLEIKINEKLGNDIVIALDPYKLETEEDRSRIISFFGQIRDRLILLLCDKHERIVPDIMEQEVTVTTTAVLMRGGE